MQPVTADIVALTWWREIALISPSGKSLVGRTGGSKCNEYNECDDQAQ
jgi:hypothetical protein